jgi:molecular chaperone HscA
MLLQIHEPGQSSTPHADDIAVGIDLGTTNSLVAVSHDDVPQVISDENGNFILPSIVGSLASVKRLMGLGYVEAEKLINDFGFEVNKERSEKIIYLKAGDKEITPIEFSAEILKQLKKNAEIALGYEVKKAVITVPAYFNESQRIATKDAAKLAGLDALRLINEPTAAALAYGLDKKSQGIYAVYDLGGGTFDVSILKMQMGVFKVIATGGDTKLGGDDIDLLLAKYIIKTLQNSKLKELDVKKLARDIKEKLSFVDEVEVKLSDYNLPNSGNEIFKINKLEFNNIIGDIADKTILIFENVLKDAKLKASQLDGVIMVGGSTRTQLVRDRVEGLTGKKPLIDINPDKVVAMGAAIQAEALTRGSNNLLLDVTPLSLGLETYGGLMEVLIQRNSPIPAQASQKFTTYEDGQTGMIIHVLQGEREMAENCRSLAKFELKGIPSQQAGTPVIEVKFNIDADGILTVSAKEEKTNTQTSVEVKPSYGLTSEEMEKMLIASHQQAKADIMARILQEARIEADIVIKTLLGALKKDGNLISNEYKAKILEQIEVVKQAIEGSNRDIIDAEVKNLDMIASDFADARTSEALKSYLTGKKVNEFN